MTTYTIHPLSILEVLLVYASLFVVIRFTKKGFDADERKTALVVGGLWATLVFIANILLERAGLMSPLPLVNNLMHTGLWIGICLTFLYFGIREREPIWAQCVAFAIFSLVVKVAERILFGTWEHGHFFHVFRGNAAYILGWSLADGLYPIITILGVRLLARFIPGLMPL